MAQKFHMDSLYGQLELVPHLLSILCNCQNHLVEGMPSNQKAFFFFSWCNKTFREIFEDKPQTTEMLDFIAYSFTTCNRIGVDEWLRVPSLKDVFSIGDCSGYLESTGKTILPALAQVSYYNATFYHVLPHYSLLKYISR